MKNWKDAMREEVAGIHPPYLLARLILSPLPNHVAPRLRAQLIRWLGFRGVSRTALMHSLPRMAGHGAIHKRLKIGDITFINARLLF